MLRAVSVAVGYIYAMLVMWPNKYRHLCFDYRFSNLILVSCYRLSFSSTYEPLDPFPFLGGC